MLAYHADVIITTFINSFELKVFGENIDLILADG